MIPALSSKIVVIVATIIFKILLGSVECQDEYMTCSRPVKSYRSSRHHIPLPCETMDNESQSWCTLPGPLYPWHSVRRFVFENQGLMRRMYGEVRQLSLLRMEFLGNSNLLDESRDLNDDDFIVPLSSYDPSTTFITTESMPTLVVTSLSEGDKHSSSTLLPITSSDEKFSSTTTDSSILNSQYGGSSSLSEDEIENDRLTTIPDITTTDTIMDGFSEEENSWEIVKTTNDLSSEITTTASSQLNQTSPTIEDDLVIIDLVKSPTIQNSTPIPIAFLQILDEKVRTESEIKMDDFISKPGTSSTEESQNPTSKHQGVNACPVKEEVVAPYWANNTRGEVLALLNLYPFEQYIHWEKCTNEHRQMYCRDGCRCEQQYRLHRLLAFDPQNECRGIFSDWFRFPSCCVCKCYFDDVIPEKVSFNRSPRVIPTTSKGFLPDFNNLDLDGPDVNGVDSSHFFYKYDHSFRQPRRK